MISDLISTESQFEKITSTIQSKNTAIIGSVGKYVPLTTYYNDNQPKVHWLLTKIFGQSDADYINMYNNQFGFFAGTMFWVNLDSITEILNLRLWANNFPSESAQLDGTTAHAIERLLCVVPEYSKMDIYEVSKRELKKIPHKTEYIPEWSDYYHDKKG
jgi:lipopolysaccharide biosynthesis protein